LTTLYAEATLDCVQTARALVAAGSRKRLPAANKRGDRRHAHRQRHKKHAAVTQVRARRWLIG
jgi:hypothetical protein